MELVAEKREVLGKKVKKIREERKIPAVMFGKGIDSISLSIDLNDFVKAYKKAGETSIINLVFNGNKESVLIKEVQWHPVTSQISHVGFYKVDLTQKITAEIPVKIIGEKDNVLIKSEQAMALTLLSEISVEALPMDLPTEFIVDIAGLQEIGDGILVKDLSYDKDKVAIVDMDEEETVVKLDYAEMQEIEEEEELSEEELIEGIEVTGEVDEEGEEGEEGEEKAEEKPSTEDTKAE